jgi:hypothetical protein
VGAMVGHVQGGEVVDADRAGGVRVVVGDTVVTVLETVVGMQSLLTFQYAKTVEAFVSWSLNNLHFLLLLLYEYAAQFDPISVHWAPHKSGVSVYESEICASVPVVISVGPKNRSCVHLWLSVSCAAAAAAAANSKQTDSPVSGLDLGNRINRTRLMRPIFVESGRLRKALNGR